MSNGRGKIGQFRSFLSDVGMEMKKISWPEKQELLGSTAVVIFSAVLVSVFVGLCDKLLVSLLRAIIS
jgi:preprotein translocase subunit SecE